MNDIVTKTIEEWEKEKGFIITGDVDITKAMTEDEFNAIDLNSKHGVNHAGRVKFLEDNGYPVTRENMIDANLSARG